MALTAPVQLGEGPLWDSLRSRLMWVDIAGRTVHEFDPATGADRSVCFDVPVGAVVPRNGGGMIRPPVRRYLPDGRADLVVDMPVPHATSVAFGGADLADLYVTTSQLGLGPADLERWPDAGALFRVDQVGHTGREPNRYAW